MQQIKTLSSNAAVSMNGHDVTFSNERVQVESISSDSKPNASEITDLEVTEEQSKKDLQVETLGLREPVSGSPA